ncbi:DUF924 family protein [Prochlorothrix hollandica]|uniref:Membrane protein n=1 Tax=Prochlorothrix hollandica PCC 9006 = CALU 1027 TaxID=317619 RepID=A0A0M2Q298_PROHO|nr:DUF924 family protein [Prochlorothrix hollandica]KKJ01104.1 membrane protein [Prochlorothrix hollandica PCC 9006 = CALU 1027]
MATNAAENPSPRAVLDFWFGSPTDSTYGQTKAAWFRKDPDFDDHIRQHFLVTYSQAAAGALNHWQQQPLSCLALIVVLDQFPRNLFRHQPAAFATDAQARAVAEWGVQQGWDRSLLPVQRWFFYLPWEHSEDLADQDRAVALFTQLEGDTASASPIAYAQKHRAVIQRFGRFPHRNPILNRESTPEEIEFLQQPGSSF